MQSFRCFLAAIVLLAAPLALGVEYHVNQASLETTQDGSAAFPFHTITQASAVMVAGDTCIIHAGTYRELLRPGADGTAASPIRYQAAPGETVVVSATESVTGWEVHAGKIHRAASVNMPLGNQNMVFFNDAAQQLARWPNDTDGNPFTYDAYHIKTTAGSYSDSFITHDDLPDYWDEGVMFWLGAHSGCAVQRQITGIDAAANRLSFTPFPDFWPFGTHSPSRLENGHRGIFYLMGKLEALDNDREWYYDEATETLYYQAPGGVHPSAGTVEVAVRERTLDLSRDHIEIDGLTFFGAPLRINGDHNTFTNLIVRECVNTLITDADGAVAGGAAVLFYGTDNTIERSLVEEGSATGINIGMNATNTTVRNCIIRNFDKQGNHCSPLRSSGPNALVTRNRIYGSARDVTRVTGPGSVLSYNEISDGLLANTDGGLFYVTGNSTPVDVEIHHNWFYSAYSPYYTSGHSTGIYLDNNAAGFRVHHNVVWDVEWGGLHFNWTAVENEIYNNTFWNVGYDDDEGQDYAVILSWIPVRNGVPTDVRDNILINNLSDTRTWWDSGAGNVTEDETLDNTFRNNHQAATAPFVSIAQSNFMLQAGSPLIDAGETVAGITDGFVGSAPDVGAYEVGGEFWVPGPDWSPASDEIPASDSRLTNLSVRTPLAPNQNLIVGFVTDGGAKDLLVRAVGPGLSAFLTGAHPDPRMTIYDAGNTAVAENDDWTETLAPTMAELGAFPFDSGSTDAALVQPVHGPHTAHIQGTGEGIVLLEAYDAGDDDAIEITNVSARNFVGDGDQVLIAGFVIEGTTPRTVLIRGVGPTLADFGVSGALADPLLRVFDAAQTKVAENDNWWGPLRTTFTPLGAFALKPGSRDAALQLTLDPGSYTVQVSGASGDTGEALVEIYAIP